MKLGIYFDRKRPGKKVRSDVWNKFNEIVSRETNQIIDHFYYCINCKDVIDNYYTDDNTNRLKRHTCFSNNKSAIERKSSVSKFDKDCLKRAAVHFVVKDLRPFYAMEGDNDSLLKNF